MIEAVIWDFHGTLADTREIIPLIHDKKYDEFYEASLSCPPIPMVADAARQANRDAYTNVLLTGMPDRYRAGLSEWLVRHGVPVSLVLMRTKEDGFAKDYVVKRRMYQNLLDLGYRAVRAWEDSPAVIALWNRQGIPVQEMPRVSVHAGTEVDVTPS